MISVLLTFIVLFFVSCSGNTESNGEEKCNLASIESELTLKLDNVSSSVDFSFYIERDDGKNYSYDRGSSTLDSTYESASTSKWVSAAIILWTIEQASDLDVNDSPNEHYAWSMSSSDPLYSLTLKQLLSFTSGLQEEATCLKLGIPSKTYDACINDATNSLVNSNQGNSYIPGTRFYYSASHLQLAGAMSVAASNYSDWGELFTAFKSATGLFFNSTYSLPSTLNPRLAGGMTWTGRDYVDFLRALYKRSFLSQSSHDEMFKDQIGSLTIEYSPAFDSLGEQWHYGYGVWLQCESPTFNCSEIDYYSSPGAYGAYPFISFNKEVFGIISRQGTLGTYPEGVNLYREIQNLSESWAKCK